VRRMEVFTGAGHRRTWSPELNAQIVAESGELQRPGVGVRGGASLWTGADAALYLAMRGADEGLVTGRAAVRPRNR